MINNTNTSPGHHEPWLAAARSTDPLVTSAAVARLVNAHRSELTAEVRFGADPEELPPVASLRKAPIPVVAGLIAATSDPERIRALACRRGVAVERAVLANAASPFDLAEAIVANHVDPDLAELWAARPDADRLVAAASASPAGRSDRRRVDTMAFFASVAHHRLRVAVDLVEQQRVMPWALWAACAISFAAPVGVATFCDVVERLSEPCRRETVRSACRVGLADRATELTDASLRARVAGLLTAAGVAATPSAQRCPETTHSETLDPRSTLLTAATSPTQRAANTQVRPAGATISEPDPEEGPFDRLVALLEPRGVAAVELGLDMAGTWAGSFESLVDAVELLSITSPTAVR